MLIIPELQIEGGRLVTRISPDKDNIVHEQMPLDAVSNYEAQGPERLHILDVDAALGRKTTNEGLIREIISGTHIPVQVAGGMRTGHQIERWFEHGAAQVVLGTLAITDQSLLAGLCALYPAGILVNVATKGGCVMIDGWRTQTAFRPEDIVYDLQMMGVAGLIHFDVDRHQSDPATSLALTMEMKRNVVVPVYSSGTVHSLDDVAKLRYLPDIRGVIVGEALIKGVFTLEEALAVAGQGDTSPEPAAETAVSVQRMQKGLQAYLAAYSLSPAAQWWNRELQDSLTADNPFIELVIPQKDLAIDPARFSPRQVQAAYEAAIEESDAVVVILDGLENVAWTGFECGYARANGKFLIGVATGGSSAERERFEAMCDEVVHFDASLDSHIIFSQLAKELSTKLVMGAGGRVQRRRPAA